MAAVPTTAKRAPKAPKPRKKPAAKRSSRPLSHAQLLKLAAKHRPPQSWYDEQIDPTKPEPSSRSSGR